MGEPQLGRRSLYANLNRFDTFTIEFQSLWNVISFCDGENTIDQIAVKCNISKSDTLEIIDRLFSHGLIEI